MFRNVLNKAALIITIIIASIIFYFYSLRTYYMHGDALGYYMYLPATFIYHNNKHLEQLPADKGIYPGVLNSVQSLSQQKTPKGYTLLQYTYGIALMEAPFFFIAHGYELASGRQANGYSDTYNYMLIICSLTYTILGLMLVYKILKNYFTATEAQLVTLLLLLATNLLWFSLFQGGMAHTPIFFLYALLIYLTIKLYRRPTAPLFIGIGFIAGLITIIRPTDVLCLLIPLCYSVYDKGTLQGRIAFIGEHRSKILLAAASFIVPVIPQLIYWKQVAGSYVFYSYGQQSFHWLHPKIIDGVFYFQNGWLPYAPIMIFALAGMLFYRRIKEWTWCLLLILPLYIYVIYSWYCYQYINGLGSRPMIHMYPLLAIPLAAFLSYVSKRNWAIKAAFGAICLFFIAMNICYSMQKSERLLLSEETNMEYNFQMLFRRHLHYNDMVTYDIAEWQPDTGKITKISTLACNNYDDSVSDHYVRDTVFGSRYIYRMDTEGHMPGVKVTYSKNTFKDAKWIKCSGKFLCTETPDYFKHVLVISNGTWFWKGCRIESKIGDWANDNPDQHLTLDYSGLNKWGYVFFYVKVPRKLREGDEIKLSVWNSGKRQIFVDDLCLELYK